MPIKILYGVQGTGNGHISRARKMASHFAERSDVEVDWLFSGRDREQLFDMAAFGDFKHRRGLTFRTRNGRVDYGSTLQAAAPLQFLRDVRNLPLDSYDLIISDFEPVTAWAARKQRREVIGIGHQYAFDHAVPEANGDFIARTVMRWFAPAGRAAGLHWHPFGQPILPPIIDIGLQALRQPQDYTLVYLPFEDQRNVVRMLQALPSRQFVLYSPALEDAQSGNVALRKTCLDGFRHDLCGASRVICNAGFELVSECLHLGLPVLVKPLQRQVEQASNARALTQLGWGSVATRLDPAIIEQWLKAPLTPPSIRYPDVAAALVGWLCTAPSGDLAPLAAELWKQSGVMAEAEPEH